MANPKYAGLPGIAPPDEKDVYETEDLPEADQSGDYLEEVESDYIDRPHISITDAHSRFKDKTLVCGKGVDFSDRYRRLRHAGYQTSGEWEIAPQGEQESIQQRYNRLQCEFRELIQDINKLKAAAAESKSAEVVTSAAHVPELEQMLSQLNSCLHLNEAELMLAQPDTGAEQIKKLLTKIDLLKTGGTSSSAEKTVGSSSKKSKDGAVLSYMLQTLPAQGTFMDSARVADLEQRLTQLETVLGPSNDNLKRLQMTDMKSVCEATQVLGARISLLDGGQVDRIDTKLSTVLAKMDLIADKHGGQDWQEKEQKVNDVYELLKKSQSLTESTKPITERLLALKSLHTEAGEFKKSLSELQAEQTNMTTNIVDNQAAMEKLRASLQQHLQTVTASIQALEGRLLKVTTKK